MPTDVRCLMETDDAHALVRLVGSLDPAASASVRRTLLTCLADQAGAIVVDVSELRFADPAVLETFTDLDREIADWPNGQLLRYLTAMRSAAAWRAAGIAVSDSLTAVHAHLDPATAGRQLRIDLEPVVGAARRARELVTDGCARWDLPQLVGSACITVTEMVNNVVAHAGTPMIVRVGARDGALRVSVRDWNTRAPAFVGLVPATSAGGRGLLLIDTTARRWGTSRLDDGKVVWAILYPEDEPVD
ncbi:MAG TPA: ATP-binding protein [Micromonospora sp.]